MTLTPLAIAFTPDYFVPAATMLRSLLDASTGDFEVICLVTETIPPRMQEKLLRLGGGAVVLPRLGLRSDALIHGLLRRTYPATEIDFAMDKNRIEYF